MNDFDIDRVAPDFPSAEYDRWKTTEPDEENPNYSTEFDDRVRALSEADLKERARKQQQKKSVS